MPSIKNIDKFVQLLDSLGDEPRIRAERGQRIEPAVVPDKNSDETNPFLVDIENDTEEIPNLADQIEDDEELLDDFDFGDFDDVDDAPDLEENDDFSLDQIDDFENIDGVDDINELGGLDDIDNNNVLEDLDDLDDLDASEDLDDLDPLGDLDDLDASEDLDDLDPLGDLDDLDASEDLDDLDPLGDLDDLDASEDLDDLDPLGDLDDLDASEDLDDLDPLGDLDDLDASEDLDDLDPLGDLDDLDASEDLDDLDSLGSLDELDTLDSGIEELNSVDDINAFEDVNIDDIGIEEIDEAESLESEFDTLSIEDDVLEADFGALEDEDSDEFSLGDFGDSFNIDQESSSSISLDEFTAESEEESEEDKEPTYTQEDFDNLKKNLANLPLNLKIAIEEEITENGLFGTKLYGLIDLLIGKPPLKDVVKFVNKKLGKNIKISPSFAKLTAEEFESKKSGFSYLFINNVMPRLKWIFPGAIAASLLFLAGYFWGYKIFKSESIYKEGHELILVDKYEEAYDKFLKAFNVHRKMKWYNIYADTYYDRKAYNYAEEIYLQIINENPSDKKATLSYAYIKGFDQGEYETATHFLNGVIENEGRDYDLMVTLGDLYLKWAEIEPSHYEDARLWYAETMTSYGPKPDILFKYLNYFIKTGNLQEVLRYRRMFEISEDIKVDGDIYAKMAGFMMDNGLLENVRESLFRGVEDNPRNPNIHYQLSRYFKRIENDREAEKAARNAIFYYEYGGYLTPSELESLVDTKRILGNLYADQERYSNAETDYRDAVNLYENLLERNFVSQNRDYGEIYADYGDIFYYASNSYTTALTLFNKAESNGFTTDELSYKKGFIDYQFNNMKDALYEFHQAEDITLDRQQIMFAKANTLSHRGSYSSAITYYNMQLKLLQKMEEEEETLYPSENESHLSLIESYIRIYNNIGVTLYKMNGERSLPEVGMNFTKSTEYYDYLTRDPDLLIRSGLRDLAYYNTRAILYPDRNIELLLYNSIPKDFNDPNLGIVASLDQQ